MKAASGTALILYGALAFMVLAAAPFYGAVDVTLESLRDDPTAATIFWELRVPRLLLGFFTGAGLSLCGLAYQSLFQNPLASPYTLGVSSGAAFGATLALMAGLTFDIAFLSAPALCGIGGALASAALVIALSRLSRTGSVTLLLCGVVVSFFFSSLVLFLQYLSDFTRIFQISRWLMGTLEGASYTEVALLAAITIAGALLLMGRSSELDLISCGEDLALARGVDTGRLQMVVVVLTSLMVGLTVSLAGPIGFVGIIVPHLVKTIVCPLHCRLLPCTFFIGGVFLVICDTFARTITAPFEIPVGVITALLGGPFFLVLLLSRRRLFSRNE